MIYILEGLCAFESFDNFFSVEKQLLGLIRDNRGPISKVDFRSRSVQN